MEYINREKIPSKKGIESSAERPGTNSAASRSDRAPAKHNRNTNGIQLRTNWVVAVGKCIESNARVKQEPHSRL